MLSGLNALSHLDVSGCGAKQVRICDVFPSARLKLGSFLHFLCHSLQIRDQLQGLPALKTVNLSHNHLTEMKDTAFKDSPSIEHLLIHDNQLSQLSILSQSAPTLRSLKLFDVSNNLLEDLPSLAKVPNLQYLSLRGNRWADLTWESQCALHSLRTSLHFFISRSLTDIKSCALVDSLPPLHAVCLSPLPSAPQCSLTYFLQVLEENSVSVS